MRFPVVLTLFVSLMVCRLPATEKALFSSEIIFPLEHWHNHASSIVEAPNGDLWVCWFHGSGERKADDVKIEGSRKRRGASAWAPRFTMADTPEYPDTNPTLFIDPRGRLWLLWPTILANEWHTALMKYRISSDYRHEGPPRWETSEVMHLSPGTNFVQEVARFAATFAESLGQEGVAWLEEDRKEAKRFLEYARLRTQDKLSRRLGWMTRAHPLMIDEKRLIVPLYSDGFSLSMMAITDDWGKTWHTSAPLCGAGNIQPSLAQRRDGSLYCLMRDNGPPPKRLLQSESRDRGETWGPVTDSSLPNPGSGAELIGLRNGHWALISNDSERARNSLCVQISEDEGRTWRWKRHLEFEPEAPDAGSYHYPSLMQAKDGSLHATYSYHLSTRGKPRDAAGEVATKSIKHAHFNEAWVMKSDDESQTRIRGAAGLRDSGLQAVQGVPSDVIGQR